MRGADLHELRVTPLSRMTTGPCAIPTKDKCVWFWVAEGQVGIGRLIIWRGI